MSNYTSRSSAPCSHSWWLSGQVPRGKGISTVKNVYDRRDFTQFQSSGSGRRGGAEAGQDE